MPLLDEAISAHGGIDRWRRTSSVALDVRIGGKILATKFASPRTRAFRAVIETRHVQATLTPFPEPGLVGVFDAERVRIQRQDGAVVAERALVHDGEGRVRRRWMWDDLDVLYFLGYALWNYTCTPFVFDWPGFECREAGRWRESTGEEWRVLDVRFPHGFATHCRDQRFYFDRDGLLCRLDYTAEVFSSMARGVHLCGEHRSFDGFVWPTHRVVYPRRRDGTAVRFIEVMAGWIDAAVIVEDGKPDYLQSGNR